MHGCQNTFLISYDAQAAVGQTTVRPTNSLAFLNDNIPPTRVGPTTGSYILIAHLIYSAGIYYGI
jgi:hypothetical protein